MYIPHHLRIKKSGTKSKNPKLEDKFGIFEVYEGADWNYEEGAGRSCKFLNSILYIKETSITKQVHFLRSNDIDLAELGFELQTW